MALVGIQTKTISGKIQPQVQDLSSGRLLIFGTALDGPLNAPRRITSTQAFTRIYGPANYSNGYKDPLTGAESGLNAYNSLALAVEQAFAAGCADVWVSRVTGATAAASAAFSGKLDFRAVAPGRIYNEVTLTTSASLGVLRTVVTQPAVKGNSWSVAVGTGETVSQYIDAVNSNPFNTTFVIRKNSYPSILQSVAYTANITGTVTLSGGTNGTRAPGEDYGPGVATGVNGYASMLTATDTGAFDYVRNQMLPFDIAVLTDLYVDDQVVEGANATTTSVIRDFVSFIDKCSVDLNPCHGVIAVRPTGLTDTQDVLNYINSNLLATSYGAYNSTLRWNKAGPFLYEGFIRTEDGDAIDSGSRLSVVGGSEAIFSTPSFGLYQDQWHVSYAALLTTLPPERSPNNIKVPGVVSFPVAIPRNYCDKLINGVGAVEGTGVNDALTGRGAYVVAARDQTNFNGPFVIYDDPTITWRDDFLRQFQLVNLTNKIHSDISRELRRFLGGPVATPMIAAMQSAVKNILEGYSVSGALKGGSGDGYDFKIYLEGNDADLGAIHVWVMVDPARALRKIYQTMTIKK